MVPGTMLDNKYNAIIRTQRPPCFLMYPINEIGSPTSRSE